MMTLHIALAKGRIHKQVMAYLQESGYDFRPIPKRAAN